jgi:hypothetical protein
MPQADHTATAARIRKMAQEHRVVYVRTAHDAFAHHVTRLSDDVVELDEIERLLIALQRSGHLTRTQMVQLQADYLREARS